MNKEIKTIMGCNVRKFIEIDIYHLNNLLKDKARVLTREEEYKRDNNNNSSIYVEILEDSNKCFNTILQEVMNVNRVYQTENKRDMIQIVFD